MNQYPALGLGIVAKIYYHNPGLRYETLASALSNENAFLHTRPWA